MFACANILDPRYMGLQLKEGMGELQDQDKPESRNSFGPGLTEPESGDPLKECQKRRVICEYCQVTLIENKDISPRDYIIIKY